MIEELRTLAASGEVVSLALLGMIIAAFKAFRVLSNAMELHEQHFVRKRHKRLLALRESVDAKGPFASYFDEAIQLEAFRTEFGVRTSPLKARALLALWESGYWERNQLREIMRFLVVQPPDKHFTVEVSKADRVVARLAMGCALLLTICGGGVWIALALTTRTVVGYFCGLFLFLAFVVAGRMFATTYGRYKSALRAQDQMRQSDRALSTLSWKPQRSNATPATDLLPAPTASSLTVDVTEQ